MIYKKHLIGAVFFASGLSSLIYQAAWQRILTLYYSVENVSTTLIVTVYMLGLGLGAIIGGRIAERVVDKVRLYTFIELGIGLFGCISMPFMEIVGKNTVASGYTVSFLCMFLLLCIPTMLMGMTLPLLTKIFNSVANNFLQSLSYLYFINTLGAALGVVATSYVLISFWGLDISIYVAAAINVAIALTLWLSKKSISLAGNSERNDERSLPDESAGYLKPKIVYCIVFVTGFVAIGYEIIWFRIIGTIVKASPYSFSTVLAVYLMGIALGSYLMKRLLEKNTWMERLNRRSLFFSLQVLIACYVLFSISAYHFLVGNVKYFHEANFNSFNNLFHPSADAPPNYRIGSLVMWLIHKSDIVFWPALFIFVPTVLMGASFPLITSLGYFKGKEADTVGRVYFFNVLGNVLGGLITGLLLLGILGTEYSLIVLSFIGLLFLFFNGRIVGMKNNVAKIFAVCIIAFFCILFFPKRQELYRTIHPDYVFNLMDEMFVTEDTDGVVVTYRNGERVTTFINGMTHGGRPNIYYFHEAIQTLSYSKPKKVLVIGLGTGTTLEVLKAVSPMPEITLVELSNALLRNLQHVDTLRKLMNDKHVRIVCADGRSFLYRNQEKFDAIFMDPLRTTTSFSNNIYSKQFFELVSNHLEDNGVLMTWTDEANVVPKTLCTVFPHVNMYSFFAVSSKLPLKENTVYKKNLTERFPQEICAEINKYAAAEVAPRDRKKILEDTKAYPINEDYRPVCEYFIGYRDNYRGVGKMFYNR